MQSVCFKMEEDYKNAWIDQEGFVPVGPKPDGHAWIKFRNGEVAETFLDTPKNSCKLKMKSL